MPIPRSYVPPIANIYATPAPVDAIIGSYGYGSAVDSVIEEIDLAAAFGFAGFDDPEELAA